MIQTFDAIVLKPMPFDEGGLVVSFLTDLGERVSGVARGAKKPVAKWVSAFEPLSTVRVSFFGKEHSELRRVTRCELHHSPMSLGHLESGLAIACLADLADRIAKEGLEDPRLFRLASACSRAFGTQPDRSLSILAYGEHWLLYCMGLLPNPAACGNCGRDDTPFASLSESGWRCTACVTTDSRFFLPDGTKEHLQKMRTSKPEDAPMASESEASKAVTQLLRSRLLDELGMLKSYKVLFKVLGAG